MNVVDNMIRLQQRLIERRAKPQTVAMLDQYITLAQRVGGNEHTSQLKVLHRLMRTPEANRDTAIYNDLAGIEEELESARDELAREREAIEARPMPKLHKYYKNRKDHS